MKKTHSKMRLILGVLAMSAFMVFSGCGNGTTDPENSDKNTGLSDPTKDGTGNSGNGNGGSNSGSTTDNTITDKKVGKYFSVESCSEGIKITLADGLKIKENGGNSISVLGNAKITITNDNIQAKRKEYIYPMLTKGESYTLKISFVDVDTDERLTEELTCKAGGGMDYTKFINPMPILTSSLDIEYVEDNPDFYFNGWYDIDADSVSEIILNPSIFEKAQIDFVTVLGKKNYSGGKTTWWVSAKSLDLLEPVDDDKISLFRAKNGFHFENWQDKKPTNKQWEEHNFEYAGYAIPTFYLKDYPDTCFELDNIWSEQKKYTNSSQSGDKPEKIIECTAEGDAAYANYIDFNELVEEDSGYTDFEVEWYWESEKGTQGGVQLMFFDEEGHYYQASETVSGDKGNYTVTSGSCLKGAMYNVYDTGSPVPTPCFDKANRAQFFIQNSKDNYAATSGTFHVRSITLKGEGKKDKVVFEAKAEEQSEIQKPEETQQPKEKIIECTAEGDAAYDNFLYFTTVPEGSGYTDFEVEWYWTDSPKGTQAGVQLMYKVDDTTYLQASEYVSGDKGAYSKKTGKCLKGANYADYSTGSAVQTPCNDKANCAQLFIQNGNDGYKATAGKMYVKSITLKGEGKDDLVVFKAE